MSIHSFDDFRKAIATQFPEFRPNPDHLQLEFMLSSEFGQFLADKFLLQHTEVVEKGVGLIEEMLESPEEKIQNLTVIGILEAIQNQLASDQSRMDTFAKKLPDAVLSEWQKLQAFWQHQE